MSTAILPRLETDRRCEVITDAAGLERLQPKWHALLERSSANEVMLAPTWLLTWWRVFGEQDGRRLRTATFYDGDRLIGLAPFLLRRHWYRPGIPFRRLESLGAGERAADAICSDYLNVIAERGAEELVVRELVRACAGGKLGRWDELVIPMMDGGGQMPDLLTREFRGAGFQAQCETTSVAPYLSLPATWDGYLKSLAKKKRYSIVSALRDFEEWAGGTATLHCAASRAELDEGRRILIALHHERWEEAAGTGTFRSPRFLAFHETVQSLLLNENALELLWLTARGEPVAALYSLLGNGKTYFYQCGRKMDLPKQVRPGIVIIAHAIRRAIEAGRREFDFLAGHSFYKTQFTVAARPIVTVRVVRSCLVERLRCVAEQGIAFARSLRNVVRAAASWRPTQGRAGTSAGSSPQEKEISLCSRHSGTD